jgi:uncharacterized protein (TIGR02391 family)
MANFELKFDPKTIEHLGVKMYATLPPALAELISNAYDADSDTVKIIFHEQNKEPKSITIIDQGIGMDSSDIQNKFLVIGRNRRNEDGDKPSPKHGRLPTGKKGLGKLALFGLAKKIKVDTVRDGLRNRFELDWDNLLSAKGTYNPVSELENQKTEKPNGTTITLSELKRKTSFDVESLADSLSKIFIVDESFSISLETTGLDKKEIEITNERKYKQIDEQFSWTEDDLIPKDSNYYSKIKLQLITSKTPIPPNSGLRGITLFSRGKLVNAPEYFASSTSSHFFQYLTGWIKADFVDLVDEDVIATNRQSINWDHSEMADFREFLSKLVMEVGRSWRDQRSLKKEKDFQDSTGIDKEKWLSTLPTTVKNSIEKIVDTMSKDEEISSTYVPVIKALHDIVPEYPLLHWRHLHKNLQDNVGDYYKNKQYGHAADQGAKIYASAIRDLTGLDMDGTELANLFGYKIENNIVTKLPKISVNRLSTASEKNLQEGQGHLTRGLMQGFRNPINHAPIDQVVPSVFSELDCLNILSLISYLMTRLDKATVN